LPKVTKSAGIGEGPDGKGNDRGLKKLHVNEACKSNRQSLMLKKRVQDPQGAHQGEAKSRERH